MIVCAASGMVVMRRIVCALAVLNAFRTRDIDRAVGTGHLDTSLHEWIAVDVGNIIEDCIGRWAWGANGVLELGHIGCRQIPNARNLANL